MRRPRVPFMNEEGRPDDTSARSAEKNEIQLVKTLTAAATLSGYKTVVKTCISLLTPFQCETTMPFLQQR